MSFGIVPWFLLASLMSLSAFLGGNRNPDSILRAVVWDRHRVFVHWEESGVGR